MLLRELNLLFFALIISHENRERGLSLDSRAKLVLLLQGTLCRPDTAVGECERE